MYIFFTERESTRRDREAIQLIVTATGTPRMVVTGTATRRAMVIAGMSDGKLRKQFQKGF